MAMLFVKCHACHHPFPSGIAYAEVDSGKVQMLGILERCPRCRDEGRYDTHEFFFPKGVEDAKDQAIGPGSTDSSGPPGATEPTPEPAEPQGNRDRPPAQLTS